MYTTVYICVLIQTRVTAEADRGVEREASGNDAAVTDCGGEKQNDGSRDASGRETTRDAAC